MTQQILKTMTFSVALLLSTASFPAYAIDANVSATVGGVNADANVSVGTSGGSSGGSGGDSLATVTSTGNPVGGDSQTDIIINLGSLLDGITIGDGADGADGSDGAAGGGGGGGGGFQMLANRLSANDLALLRPRCNQILADPNIYKPDVIEFCRVILRLPM